MEIITIALCLSIVGLTAGEMTDIRSVYIFDVKPSCGKSVKDNNPAVNIMSDFPVVSAHAVCNNGDKNFITFDNVEYILQGSLRPKGDICLFTRRGSANVYTIDVVISYGTLNNTIQQQKMKYIVTCTYDLNGDKLSSTHSLTKGILAPKEVRVDVGAISTSKLVLDVHDVGGNVVSTLHRGRKVYLAATSDGKHKEVGIKPISCYAIGTSKDKFAFLRAGCGAGIIFGHKEGFTTKGLTTKSPYFKSFQLNDDSHVAFECVFTLCAGNCDGTSCGKTRRKRSTAGQQIVLRTNTLTQE